MNANLDQSITLIVETDDLLLSLSADLPLTNFREPVRLFLATLAQLHAAGGGDSDPEARHP